MFISVFWGDGPLIVRTLTACLGVGGLVILGIRYLLLPYAYIAVVGAERRGTRHLPA